MHLRLITIAAAFWAAYAGAASLQPVDAGLQPLYDRIAVIQKVERAVDLKLQKSGMNMESRTAARQRLTTISAEQHQLEDAIERSKAVVRASWVTFAGPATKEAEQRKFGTKWSIW